MFPHFSFFSPTFELPLSGDVSQGISTNFGPDIAGIIEVEHEVVTSVASYGKQLGKLTEAVLALADKIGLEGEEIEAVRTIASGVEAAKCRAADAVWERAEAARLRSEKLDDLRTLST